MQLTEQVEMWLVSNQHRFTLQEMADHWRVSLSEINKARNKVCEKHGLKKRKTYITTPALSPEPRPDQRRVIRGVYSNSSPYKIARTGM